MSVIHRFQSGYLLLLLAVLHTPRAGRKDLSMRDGPKYMSGA